MIQESIGKITESEFTAEEIQDVIQEDEIVDTGLTAVALYDYQAGADDEISFDPEDIITHVETVSLKNEEIIIFLMRTICRYMRAGGEACAKENTACFLQIMCNCSSEVYLRRVIIMYLINLNTYKLF